LRGDADALAVLAHAAFEDGADAELAGDDARVVIRSLERERRAPARDVHPARRREARMSSSARPSAKYSMSLSALRSANGSTAIEVGVVPACAVTVAVGARGQSR
jgi:hypothetical protein